MTRSIPLLVAVLVVVSSSYCDAQQSCLDIAHSKLAVGSKIKIYPVNGERFSGTLESIDLQTGFLNVILAESDNGRQEGQGSSGSEPSVMSVEVTEISKITYRKMGTPQAGWILGVRWPAGSSESWLESTSTLTIPTRKPRRHLLLEPSGPRLVSLRERRSLCLYPARGPSSASNPMRYKGNVGLLTSCSDERQKEGP